MAPQRLHLCRSTQRTTELDRLESHTWKIQKRFVKWPRLSRCQFNDTHLSKFSSNNRKPPMVNSRKPQLTKPVKLSNFELHENNESRGRWTLQRENTIWALGQLNVRYQLNISKWFEFNVYDRFDDVVNYWRDDSKDVNKIKSAAWATCNTLRDDSIDKINGLNANECIAHRKYTFQEDTTRMHHRHAPSPVLPVSSQNAIGGLCIASI